MRPVTSLLAIPFASLTAVDAGAGNEWSYAGENNPNNWHVDYPHCAGKKQSPINIVTDDVILNKRLGYLTMIDYDKMLIKPKLKNNGHSAQVNIEGDLFIEAGGLPSRYKAAQFHFHWGDADRRGSEHSFDGVPFPMEMHIVHYSMDYENISEAMNKPDGLAVLAVFMQVGEETNPDFQHVISNFDSPVHKGDVITLDDLSLATLLPQDTSTYYRYSGSLTTPPCYESVVWTLYPNYVMISNDQMNKFRKYLKSNEVNAPEVALVNDYRPQQNINVRLVETNSDRGLSGSSSPQLSVLPFVLLLVSSQMVHLL